MVAVTGGEAQSSIRTISLRAGYWRAVDAAGIGHGDDANSSEQPRQICTVRAASQHGCHRIRLHQGSYELGRAEAGHRVGSEVGLRVRGIAVRDTSA
jgi:hypothetical protein